MSKLLVKRIYDSDQHGAAKMAPPLRTIMLLEVSFLGSKLERAAGQVDHGFAGAPNALVKRIYTSDLHGAAKTAPPLRSIMLLAQALIEYWDPCSVWEFPGQRTLLHRAEALLECQWLGLPLCCPGQAPCPACSSSCSAYACCRAHSPWGCTCGSSKTKSSSTLVAYCCQLLKTLLSAGLAVPGAVPVAEL